MKAINMGRVTPASNDYKSKKTFVIEIHDLEYGSDCIPAYLECDVEVIDDTHFIAATVKKGSWFVQRRDGDYIEKPYECGSRDDELETLAIKKFKEQDEAK